MAGVTITQVSAAVMAGRRVFLRSRFIFYFSVFSVFCIPFVCYFNCVCDCGVYQARIKLKRTRFCQSRLPYYSNSVSSFNVPALQILRSNDVSPQPGPFCNDSISVYYQNVRSLKAFSTNDDGLRECKLSVLKDIVYGSDFDLVALTETWLNSAVTDLEILPHYNIFRKDRTGRPGGGVLLAVKDRITVKNTLSLPGETIVCLHLRHCYVTNFLCPPSWRSKQAWNNCVYYYTCKLFSCFIAICHRFA